MVECGDGGDNDGEVCVFWLNPVFSFFDKSDLDNIIFILVLLFILFGVFYRF